MPATGSSTSSSLGSCASSMPISSHCFCPCDNPPAMRLRMGPSRVIWRMPSMRRAVALEREQDIVLDRVHLEHRRLLKLASDAELGDLALVELGEVVAAVEDHIAAVGPGLAGHHVHHGGLAGAIGADDGAHFA